MVCPECSHEPLSFGAFIYRPVATLTCQRCGANLKLDRRSLNRIGPLCMLAGLMIPSVGLAAWYSSFLRDCAPRPRLALAFAGYLLWFAVMLLVIRAWAWRVYRYAPDPGGPSKTELFGARIGYKLAQLILRRR